MSVLGAGEAFMLASGEDATAYKIDRSLRFNSADSAYLSRSPSSPSNRRTFTWSGWVKRSKLGAQSDFFSAGNSSDYLRVGGFNSSDQLEMRSDSAVVHLVTDQVFRDVSAWYHIVIAVDTTQGTASNRVKFYVNGSQVTDFSTSTYPGPSRQEAVNDTGEHRLGAFIDKTSATVYYPFNGYLADVHFIDGQALGPTDFGEFDATTGVWNPIEYTHSITATEAISYGVDNTSNAFDGTPGNYDTTGLSFGTWPGTVQNSNIGGYGANSVQVLKTNSGNAVTWTINTGSTNRYIHTSSDGINWTTNLTTISGTAVQVTSAWLGWGGGSNADYTTVSVPADNSFHLDFSDNSSNSALGTDAAGSSDWTVNNLSVASGAGNDSLIDTPTNYNAASGNNGGNYCTWNPIDSTGTNTLANGNLDCSGAQRGNRGTIAVTSGKYYYETVITSFGVGGDFGWSKSDEPCPTTDPGANSYGWSIHTSGVKRHNGSTSACISGGLAVNDVIQFAIDVTAGKVWFGKNNTWGGSGDPAAGTNAAFTNVTGPIAPAHGNGGSAIAFTTNFGQRPFAYTPPTGFKSLCTQNLPDPDIGKGALYFDAKRYQGNGGNQQITGLDFSPDLVWIKNRSTITNQVHAIFDKQRGKQMLSSSSSQSEANWHGSNGLPYRGYVDSFDTNGFSLVKNSASNLADYVNYNNATYVAWSWDAGDAANPTSISVGSLNSSVYNQSQTWSTYGSASGTTWNPAVSNLFNNDLNSGPSLLAGNTGTWTFTSGITASNSIEIYCLNGSGALGSQAAATEIRLTVSGTVHSINGVAGWINTGLTGTLTAVTIHVASGSGSSGLRAIKVDGKELVDSGVTVTNAPSIASAVRANTTAGFSIVDYTGTGSSATIGHGLNTTPEMVFYKSRGDANDWMVYHVGMGATKSMLLNDGGRDSSRADTFNNTAPTSLLLHVGGSATTSNSNSAGMIAYCFSPVPGYSSFGTFVGNGSANGPFVYTGFRPRWIMVKGQTYAGNWNIFDAIRPTYNETDGVLRANLSNPEFDGSAQGTYALGVDLLSNGFKIRQQGVDANSSGQTLIYAAFAEHPLKTARAK